MGTFFFFYPTLARGASLKLTEHSVSCMDLIDSQSMVVGEVFTDGGKVSSFQECKAACLRRLLEEGVCHPMSA